MFKHDDKIKLLQKSLKMHINISMIEEVMSKTYSYINNNYARKKLGEKDNNRDILFSLF
jgi:hypothetical protein